MNSLRDSKQACEQIEDYLDYLCAPLLGLVPYRQRRRLRLEAADHLEALAEDFAGVGFAPEEAVALACREYGEPWQVGQSFADAWAGGDMSRRLVRFAGAPAQRAFGWFGVFAVLTLLLIEQSVYQPGLSSSLPLAAALAVVSPLIAGAMTGLSLHARLAAGICRSVGVLALASGAVGLLLWPHVECFEFAGFQLVFWLPAGCLSAALSAGISRQFRLQHFSHVAR